LFDIDKAKEKAGMLFMIILKNYLEYTAIIHLLLNMHFLVHQSLKRKLQTSIAQPGGYTRIDFGMRQLAI
jgi:hypothetical protein